MNIKNYIDIPFGTDSELMEEEISIPDGFEAVIEGNKIILKKVVCDDEKIKNRLIKLIKMSSEVGGFALHKWEADEMLTWLEKQGEHSIYNVPSREVILAIWDLGNEWKELTNGSISTEYGTTLDYIQKHWHESEYYLKEKQGEQKPYGQRKECLDCQFNYASECKGSCQMKRNEQKPIDKIEPKFKVGDWCRRRNGGFRRPIKITKVLPLIYEAVDDIGYHHSIEKDCFEKNYYLWTIEDAKEGDVLQLGDVTAIFQEYIGNGNCKCYCSVCNGVFEIPSQDGDDNSYGCHDAIPATNEQRDFLFQKIKEARYEWDYEKKELKKIGQKLAEWSKEDDVMVRDILGWLPAKSRLEYNQRRAEWLKSLKDRVQLKQKWSEEDERIRQDIENLIHFALEDGSAVSPAANTTKEGAISWIQSIKPQPKQEWSEEDEEMCQETIDWFEKKCFPYALENDNPARESIKWLKSLRPQNKWKPSDEQIEALESATENCAYSEYQNCLRELIEQLKKLKGE